MVGLASSSEVVTDIRRIVLALAMIFATPLAAALEPSGVGDQTCPLGTTSDIQLRQSIEFSSVVRMDRSLPGVLSPNGAYQFWLMSPTVEQEVHSVSTIDIDSQRSDLQRISIPGVSGTIDARWVNEKLLFAEWRWPQGITARLLHDVESGAVLSLRFACDQ